MNIIESIIKKIKCFFLYIEVFFLKLSIKSDIETIETYHNRICGYGKKVGLFEKKKAKDQFDLAKEKYYKFIEFCKSKNVELDKQFLDVKTNIEEAEDAFECKTPLDWQLCKATKEYNAMYKLCNEKGELLLKIRSNSVLIIEQVENLVNSIAKHPKEFEAKFKDIKIQKEQFKEVCEFGLKQKKYLEKSVACSGAGVAAGAAVASMAPTAAMWIATTFGTTSTGTAISALSGAAATNAALAWLGGGAIAAGGSGMVAGQALLALAGPIGWGIAGASIGASALLFFRGKLKREEQQKEEIKRVNNCTETMKELQLKINNLVLKTQNLYYNLDAQIKNAENLKGKDYDSINDEQKFLLGTIVNNTKSLSFLINEVIDD